MNMHNIYNKVYKVLPAIMLPAFLLASCTQDEAEPQVREYPVQLLMGLNQLEADTIATRTLPTGYSAFAPTSDPGKIGIFMTQNHIQDPVVPYTYSDITGSFTWVDNTTWNSSVKVINETGSDKNYYVYGFMPAGGTIKATMTSATGDFASGGVMTLTNVPPVSDVDVCVVTGVTPGLYDSDNKFLDITNAAVSISEGQYGFTASTSNSVYLLLDHIYSKFSLEMKVDDAYNQLRTIKVTGMKMSASASSITVNVTYAHGSAPTVTPVKASSSTPLESTILSTETALTTTSTPLTTFYCAADASGATGATILDYIELTSTFDVYDKAGNKLRSGCTATNKISLKKLEKGKHYTIQAIVKPTYLYQLGETDLNKPTLTTTSPNP